MKNEPESSLFLTDFFPIDGCLPCKTEHIESSFVESVPIAFQERVVAEDFFCRLACALQDLTIGG